MVMIIALVFAATSATLAQSTPPSAQQYYVAALDRMRHVAQPQHLTYHATIDVDGGQAALGTNPDGTLHLEVGNAVKGKAHDELDAAVTPRVATYSVTLGDGTHATTQRPLFNAAWSGVDDWIKYGATGAPAGSTPAPLASADPGDAHVIAVVSNMGLAHYRVRDLGAATCADGTPAHALELSARGDALVHPLTYAAVDERTGLFCTLRLNAPIHSDAGVAARAVVEAHFGSVNGYYLLTDERVEAVGHLLGMRVGGFTTRITFSKFTF